MYILVDYSSLSCAAVPGIDSTISIRGNKALRSPKRKPARQFGAQRESNVSSDGISRTELTRLASLKRKKGRSKERLFLAEGIRLLEEAVKHGVSPRGLYTRKLDLSERGEGLKNTLISRGAPLFELNSRDFNRLAETEAPQGMIGLFDLPRSNFDLKAASAARRILIVENMSDPGNLGVLIRTALGFGFDLILLAGENVDPYNPKVVRASAGAIFGVTLMDSSCDQIKSLKSRINLRLLAADLQGESESRWKLDGQNQEGSETNAPLALAVGAESVGMSEELLGLADQRLRISHSARLESLNAAMAAGIIMHQMSLVNDRRE